MKQPFRVLALALLGLALLGAGAANAAEQLMIVTSFSKDITEPFKKAFEDKYPDIKVQVLNKGTSSGVAYVREAPASNKPDIFWVSSPDAFEVLRTENLLASIHAGNPAIPADIHGFPINDPHGYYYGFALSGYGFMYNTRYLKAHKLPVPREWSDLTKPIYLGHLSISSPSRSGTTHLTVETLLQAEGWEKGWRTILAICGNTAAITDRSFGVPDGVNNGQYGIGIVIDYFGLSAQASGFPIGFVYPAETTLVPATIGVVANARNPESAKKFVEFVLSEPGQKVLFNAKIMRLPALPSVYKFAPPGFPNPYNGSIKVKVRFDSQLSESRYYLVSSLFDQIITFRHKELVEATKAIDDAAARLKSRPNQKAEALLAQAREIAYDPIVNPQQAADAGFLELYSGVKKEAKATQRKTALEQHWNSEAQANYAKATDLARQAAALAK